jgi:hypothetical protein
VIGRVCLRHLAYRVGVPDDVRNSSANAQNACECGYSAVLTISGNNSRRTDRALAYQKDLRARIGRLYS